MRTVLYVTKNEIWAGEKAFDWDGVSFDVVLGNIVKEFKVDRVRVVLGSEVSFITAIKAGEMVLTRENVLRAVESWFPFEIDNECFDWKQVLVSFDELWIQVIAIEKELLVSLSSAALKHRVKVEMITTVGVLLAERTKGREAPVIVKWSDKEDLSVLAVNGLVDFVSSRISDNDLTLYAKQKWSLAVNPEEIILKENDLDLSKIIFSEKSEGEDRYVLSLPIMKDVAVFDRPEIEKHEKVIKVKEKKVVKKNYWGWIISLVVMIIIVGVVLVLKWLI